MTTTNDSQSEQRDNFDAALAAMRRATEVARREARQGSGTLVVWRGGRIVEERVESVTEKQTPKR
jgi:hypothetical protein